MKCLAIVLFSGKSISDLFQIIQAERRVKRITGELDLLRHHVEKFFIVMDRDIREKQMAENPIFRNQATWNKSAFAKGEALRSIMNLREVFRLSAGDSTIEKQVSFRWHAT